MTPGPTDAPKIPDATKLAVERTRLAYERTLMAWIRTATSLISFGFTIYKFFEFLHHGAEGEKPAQLLGARHFALLMIGTGLVALVIATLQHVRDMRVLRAASADVPYSLAAVMAALIGLLGIVGVASVILRQ
jgi:putative membrane protein